MSERYISAAELEAAHKSLLSVLATTYHLLAYAHGEGTTSAELLAGDDEASAAFAKTQYDALATDLQFAGDYVKRAGRYFPASDAQLSNCNGATWHEATLMLATTVYGVAYGRFADACLRTQEGRPTPEIWASCWPRIQDGLQGVEQFDLDATRAALTREYRAADEKLRAGDFEPTIETLVKRCTELRQFVHRLDEQSPSLFWTRGMILDCWEDMVRIDPSATLPPRPDAKQLTTVSVVAGTIEAVSEWCDKRASDEPALRRTDDDFGRWTAPHSGQSSGEEQPEGDTAHGPDFRSVRWFDSEYSFTANQSAVVRVLWEAWEAGTPDVGDETLLSAVDEDAPPSRLRDVFRNNPAWNSMIVGRGPKGTHRLAPPNENLPAQEIPT